MLNSPLIFGQPLNIFFGNIKPLSAVLSEHTSKEDLYGKDNINSEDNTVKFVPGILLNAYSNGNILILDECDLAKPEILSSILISLSKNEIIEKKNIFYKMEGYNVILTMNGEAKGFESNQRNVLTSNILSKFVTFSFDKMELEECEIIFDELLKENNENYKNNSKNFTDLHKRMEDEMKSNKRTIDPIVTLRI